MLRSQKSKDDDVDSYISNLTSVTLQFQTNNHDIVGSLFVDRVRLFIDETNYSARHQVFCHTIFTRLQSSFIHSIAQNDDDRTSMYREHSFESFRERERKGNGCEHFATMRQKTIEIEIRLYRCHFNASNRSKMSVQNILITRSFSVFHLILFRS